MTIEWLDHVNILTSNVAEMTHFYDEALGLKKGVRPPFEGIEGAWLYCGNRPVVHLVEIDQPLNTQEPQIEHFAFRGNGLATFLEKMRSMGVAYTTFVFPGYEIRQVNIHDSDGNHIEVQFLPTEEADLTNFAS